MIKTDSETIIVSLLLISTFVDKTICDVAECQHPEYLSQLKEEVRPFYTLTSDFSSNLAPQSPCTDTFENLVGRPSWPVHTLESWHSESSTCPWVQHIDEDPIGLRYPCRIATARLVMDHHHHHHHHDQTCFRYPGSRYNRSENKLCTSLQQTVPVVIRTDCRNGINDYAIRNMSITVGYTCTFVQ